MPSLYCEEWGRLDMGPSVESCMASDARGDYEHDQQRQRELDERAIETDGLESTGSSGETLG